MYDVMVIGGGASGMMAAITAARRGLSVIIIDHKERLGKKILATGNGKCNYTNRYQSAECYRGMHPEFAMDILHQFDEEETIAFFRSLGIYPKSKNGYYYPNSEQASAVADCLAMEIKRLKIKVKLSNHIRSVRKAEELFYADSDGYEYCAKSMILACGGCASEKQGSDGSGYLLAKQMGHAIIPPFPALVQLKAKEPFLSSIAGVRFEGKGTVVSDGKIAASEIGEYLFTEYGISGIPILQMSRYAVSSVIQHKKTKLSLDFFPSMSENEVSVILTERKNNLDTYTASDFLIGLFPQKLIPVLLKMSGISPKETAGRISDALIDQLAKTVKQFALFITGSNGFDQAQVSAGGVDTTQVNKKTLESLKVKELFFAGELLDIDGTCGGYNLQWAWSSGQVAGKNVLGNEYK